jgi:hypothetical protein
LTNTKGEGEESVLASLTILRDTSFEFTSTTGDNEDGTISLGSTSDHVLDEITVSGGINDLKQGSSAADLDLGGVAYSNHKFRCFEFPEGDVNGNTTLTLSLQLVKYPGCDHQKLTIELNSIECLPYLKEPFPSSAASFSNFSMVRLSIPPHL